MSESKKQRLERISVQVLAAMIAGSGERALNAGPATLAKMAIGQALEFIAALDALPPDA